jgi:hypothetical protein
MSSAPARSSYLFYVFALQCEGVDERLLTARPDRLANPYSYLYGQDGYCRLDFSLVKSWAWRSAQTTFGSFGKVPLCLARLNRY